MTRYTSIQFRCSSLICFFAQHYWSLGFQDLYFLNFVTCIWTCLFSQLLPFLSLNLCGISFRIGSGVKISQYIKPNDIFVALHSSASGNCCFTQPHDPFNQIAASHSFPLISFILNVLTCTIASIFSSDLRNVVLWFSGTWLGFFFFLWNAIRALTTSGNSTEIFPFLVILPLRENNNCH